LASAGKFAELKACYALLGLLSDEDSKWVNNPGVQLDDWTRILSEAREVALQTKDFTEVDRLKTLLVKAGVQVQMSKDGVSLGAGPEVDISKLEALK